MYKYTHDSSSEKRTVIKSFGGLDESGNAGAGEFSSISEFSSDNYPALRTRKKRFVSGTEDGGTPIIFVGDSPHWLTRDGTLHSGGTVSTDFASELGEGEERSAVMLGSVAVIFPDKVWMNTATGEGGQIEFDRTFPASDNELKLTLEFDDGTVPDALYYRTSEPTGPANGELWCSKQADGSILAQRYFSDGEIWLPQDKIRYRFTSPGISEGIAEGDYITVAALGAGGKSIGSMEKEYRVSSVGENSISIDDVAEIWLTAHVCRSDPHEYLLDSLRLTRTVPDLKYVCACGNRLWGCSADGHEIRSTALGSISSWERFDGNESDSWAVTVGSPGEFTGCAVWDGNPVFFKENELIRVFGNKPSNFGTSATACVGIERGSHFSPACVGGVLYYKGSGGFYMWDGGVPEKVSRGISDEYTNVYGAALGDKYYAAVTDKNGVRSTLVYDTVRGTWNTSSLAAVSLCTVGCGLYAVCEDEEEGTWHFVSVDRLGAGSELSGVEFAEEENFEWEATTGDLLGGGDDIFVREVNVGCRLEKGASLCIYALTDSEEKSVLLGRIAGTEKRTDVTLSAAAGPCRRFSLRFIGKGAFTLHTLSLTENAV